MKKLFFLLIISTLISCNISRRQVTNAGVTTYYVETLEKTKSGSVITLKGVKGTFIVTSDTLKVNDPIEVSWITKKRKS